MTSLVKTIDIKDAEVKKSVGVDKFRMFDGFLNIRNLHKLSLLISLRYSYKTIKTTTI